MQHDAHVKAYENYLDYLDQLAAEYDANFFNNW